MNERLRLVLMVLLAFGAALGGVLVGRAWIAPPTPVESELHTLLHAQLDLDPEQTRKIDAIEHEFALRRQALELELRADNARLASAIEAERGYGPRVAAAVDASHRAMGELQKATLEHIFAMRSVLRPDQAARFDAAVVKALTAKQR
ncbi:heavy-metal resistance protein [Novosphingobium sp. PhB165]|uniref:periplasmic heavy metal sensor n=1 Tax=Novosphingobium sp. PhB165 TaxID=2485105 RepID=UPI0010530A7C|nr:periplasmic heavy metal sensor [Novosphingobium sp. PhB165]TCM20544.1 heavy-metal resistance protein [Novosphingobium sp. PhB165]